VYLEETWNLIRSFPNDKVGGIIVIDITDCGLSFLSSVSVLTKICSSGILRYPEISEKVFIVNAGWLVTTLWTAIKPFIPSRTEEKLTILGTNYHHTLSEALFGTSEIASEGMAQLGSILSPSSSSGSLQSQANEIHTVEGAYDSILDEIFRFHSSSTTAIGTEVSTTSAGLGPFPDTREFLEAAKGFIERLPASTLRSVQAKKIDSLLLTK
jgi:hypothetical protein